MIGLKTNFLEGPLTEKRGAAKIHIPIETPLGQLFLLLRLGAPGHLDVPLAQAVQIGPDAHGAAGDVGEREGLLLEASFFSICSRPSLSLSLSLGCG